MLDSTTKEVIKRQAFLGLPNEICGLLALNGAEIFIHQCKNISRNPRLSFIIDPKDYIFAAEKGEIIASYHSHTNDFSEFSELDKVNANEHKIKSILYFFNQDKFFEYIPNDCKNIYIGRYFEIGRNDCYSLMRDYYRNELKIFLNDYSRDKSWSKTNPFLYDENYKKEDFLKILSGPLNNLDLLTKNDIILMNLYGKTSTHAAIYLGNNLILHHPKGYSRIEELNGVYKRKTTCVLRHKIFLK